jgi:hypothetical protein
MGSVRLSNRREQLSRPEYPCFAWIRYGCRRRSARWMPSLEWNGIRTARQETYSRFRSVVCLVSSLRNCLILQDSTRFDLNSILHQILHLSATRHSCTSLQYDIKATFLVDCPTGRRGILVVGRWPFTALCGLPITRSGLIRSVTKFPTIESSLMTPQAKESWLPASGWNVDMGKSV